MYISGEITREMSRADYIEGVSTFEVMIMEHFCKCFSLSQNVFT